MEKQLNVRILNKIDTVQKWEEAANFVPMNGELIVIYNGKGLVPDFKVGDGETTIGNLPLIDNELPHANNFTWGTTVLNAGGAAPYDHNHDATYLQLVGGIMTGDIKLPKLVDANGQELILDEDTTAASRGYVAAQIADLVGGMKYLGITTTPLTDKSTTDVINIEGTNIVPQAGNVVIYDGTQYIWNTNTETPHWDLISTSSADTTYSFSGSYDDNGVWTGVLVSSTGGRTGNIAPPIFEGATQTEAGKSGMVPAPGLAQDRRFLRGDGTWAFPPGDEITNVTWTDGSVAGPTGQIRMSDNTSVAIPAIPSAGEGKSGIITAFLQNFSGKKVFSDGLVVNAHPTSWWQEHFDYIPANGEIMVYTDYDSVNIDGTIMYVPGIKVGFDTAYGIDQAFVGDDIRDDLLAHINNNIIHITQAERDFWNNKISCYLDQTNAELLIFTTE